MSLPVSFGDFPVSLGYFEGGAHSGGGHGMPGLGAAEVHLWAIDLVSAPDEIEYLGSLLAADERRRAKRFHFDRHRRRYIVSQGMLRVLLARYSQLDPAELTFDYGPKGKPSLGARPDIHFNVSHSHERSVVAVTQAGPLGVDIEHLRHLPDADDIARRFFSQREAEAYLSVPMELRRRAFFNCWTRKEAFIKALGEGLFLSLDRFDVSLRPGEPTELLAIDGDTDKASDWSLTAFQLEDDFAGALAAPWSPRSVRAWHLPTGRLLPDPVR